MRGLALEGGGARGAYHIGAVKALMENGYTFDGFVGTSIGAINAALLAQGELYRALELWSSISMEMLFDNDGQQLFMLADLKIAKLDGETRSNIKRALSNIGNGGISTAKMKALLEEYIDEEQIRESGKDFGLVTFAINELKPHKLMLDNIPEGQLINYIMASASFPGFQHEAIDHNTFLDGAFHDNCPYQLLEEQGYDEIIAVRTNAPGIFRKVDNTDRIKLIVPRQDLGRLMQFSPERSAVNIQLGYHDGLRFAHKLRGAAYYIRPVDPDQINARIMALEDDDILKAGSILGVAEMPAKRMLFEKIIPQLSSCLRLGKDYDYTDFAIALLEWAAEKRKINRFRVYDYEQLGALIQETPVVEDEKKLSAVLPAAGMLSKKKTAADFLSGIIFCTDSPPPRRM